MSTTRRIALAALVILSFSLFPSPIHSQAVTAPAPNAIKADPSFISEYRRAKVLDKEITDLRQKNEDKLAPKIITLKGLVADLNSKVKGGYHYDETSESWIPDPKPATPPVPPSPAPAAENKSPDPAPTEKK